MTEHTDVVIVGAGGGGAVLGLALAQRGIRAVVLEQGLGPPSGLRGEILQPNGQRVFAFRQQPIRRRTGIGRALRHGNG